MQKRLIIDADPAIGVPLRDIDDGLAMLLLLASPEIILEGITINFGNVKAPLGYQVAAEVLRVARADVPVYLGAHTHRDLGKPNPAVDYLLETVGSNPGEISLLALAPLTNVATAMMLDPGFAANLKDLVIMGGSLNFGIFKYTGEFNFHLDARAASFVISLPVPKTMITMDVCSQAVFKDCHLEKIRANPSPVSRYLAENIAPWLNLNKKVFFRKKGFFPWDVVAAAYLVDESLFDRNFCSVHIQESGLRAGRIISRQQHPGAGQAIRETIMSVPSILDRSRFMEIFLSRLLSL